MSRATLDIGLSELSVTEFLTIARLGFCPYGLVQGVAFYDAGIQFGLGLDGDPELTDLTRAMRSARQLAVSRLRKEAEDLGADGVVGVKLDVEHHAWKGGHTVARFVAVGTAIGVDARHPRPAFAHARRLTVGGHPFTSDLSATEFCTLLQSGYRPVSLAIGNCVIQISRWGASMPGNYEIDSYTQAFMNARETAMLHLEQDLFKDYPKGSPDAPRGVVGMTVTEQAHSGTGNVVEYTALGTAVTPLAADDPRRAKALPAPAVVVPLDR